MEARDLRIGNFVKTNNHNPFCGAKTEYVEVESINESGINLTAYGGYYGEGEMDCDYNFINWKYNTHTVKPIPLTEEWLINFGFKKTKYTKCSLDVFEDKIVEHFVFDNIWSCYNWSYNYFQLNRRVLYLPSSEEHDNCWSHIPKHDHIEYVHQLQNLYFALTGFELEIKTPNQKD